MKAKLRKLIKLIKKLSLNMRVFINILKPVEVTNTKLCPSCQKFRQLSSSNRIKRISLIWVMEQPTSSKEWTNWIKSQASLRHFSQRWTSMKSHKPILNQAIKVRTKFLRRSLLQLSSLSKASMRRLEMFKQMLSTLAIFPSIWTKKIREMTLPKRSLKILWISSMKWIICSGKLLKELPSIPNLMISYPGLMPMLMGLLKLEKFKHKN